MNRFQARSANVAMEGTVETGIPTHVSLRGRRRQTLPTCEDMLLDAAKAVFLRKGIHDGTLREITRRAGLSLTMVYYYFGSKEGLVCELLRRAECRLLQDLEAFFRVPGNSPNSNEVFGDLAALLMRHLGESCILGWLIRDPGTQRYELLQEGLGEVRRRVQGCLAVFLGREPGTKRAKSRMGLKELCYWAMSHNENRPAPFHANPADASPKALLPLEDEWHERFWWTVSEHEPD